MKQFLTMLAVLMLLPMSALATETVVVETNLGDIILELDESKAPISVANFLGYVDSGHYQGTVFHRVIKDFMIQGGNFSPEMTPKATRPAIKNEAANGLRNLRGTIAMARTGVVDSATSQFFINLKDNPFLDHKDASPAGYGYAVFGRVVDGMGVVDRIGTSPTHTFRRFRDVPVEPVIIQNVRRVTKE
jgi:peptidyl-prolyl cis-trans isomerase A (cyclophilin A)